MADRLSTAKYTVNDSVNSGLEPVPHEQLPWPQKEHYHNHNNYEYGNNTNNQQPTDHEGLEVAHRSGGPKQRILGLSVRTFWIILIILVVVVAGAIGGGVGGGLAAQSKASSSSPTTASDQAGDSSTGSSGSSGSPASSESSTATTPPSDSPSTTSTPTASDTPSTTTQATPGQVSPAPSDGGCPGVNGTAFTPLDAHGKPMPIAANGPGQTFRRLCRTNWPSGHQYHNPGIYDIIKLYLPSLDDCITACAAYNVNFLSNKAAGNGISAGGLCTAVTIIKKEGEYCYLKNGTGNMDTFGQPNLYTSAILDADLS
ncbi:uncharacterized protein C8A04DRAFT_24421 [Dichotomopilus funicola]|uniref:Apple domain-containing protein n=1 Tax=Dichotomopilus funicola TaxID=1934379 RepID=A0AAN6ZR55_9PEZI|nr:hypothetical protein C8A04DRAFT_24421 [Dichotomopilus funicola]